jgi:hypothetical protein
MLPSADLDILEERKTLVPDRIWNQFIEPEA